MDFKIIEDTEKIREIKAITPIRGREPKAETKELLAGNMIFVPGGTAKGFHLRNSTAFKRANVRVRTATADGGIYVWTEPKDEV